MTRTLGGYELYMTQEVTVPLDEFLVDPDDLEAMSRRVLFDFSAQNTGEAVFFCGWFIRFAWFCTVTGITENLTLDALEIFKLPGGQSMIEALMLKLRREWFFAQMKRPKGSWAQVDTDWLEGFKNWMAWGAAQVE